MSITSDTARLILQHRFSFVDDPQKVGRNNQPKWKKDPLGGYRLNREYETDPKQYRQELLLLLTLYVEDVLGAKGRELWEKQGGLVESEKKRLHDIGKVLLKQPEKGELVPPAKSTKKLLIPISLSLGCSSTTFSLSAQEFAVLVTQSPASLPAFSVYMTDWDNASDQSKYKETRYKELDDKMKNSPADFKRVLIGIISDRKKVPDPPGFSPAIEPYLVLRSIALYNGVEIGRIDSFATIVGKLFYKLHRPKDRFPTTRVCDGDSIDVWKDMFEIPGGQSEHKAEFSEPIQ